MTNATSNPDAPHLVFAGGGTGGHLFPGVAVAQEFLKLRPEAKITFVGTKTGIEARVIPQLGYGLELVNVKPLKGGGLVRRAKSLVALPVSGIAALSALRRLRPSVVVSLGGYAAGPVTMAAAFRGVTTALMEQNSYPGLTNRLLSRHVDHAFLTFEGTADHLSASSVSVPGNPVRSDLLEIARTVDYQGPQQDGEKFKILVIGGSGGAGSFNEYIPTWMASMGDLAPRLQIRHQAGRERAGEVVPRYEGFVGDAEVVEFIDDMASAYQWCDLLICRAGASTIAEVLILGIPSIMVPFPLAADDHQTANAMSVVEAGGGIMIEDHELVSERSKNLLRGLIKNPVALKKMAHQAKSLGRPTAGREIAAALLEMMD